MSKPTVSESTGSENTLVEAAGTSAAMRRQEPVQELSAGFLKYRNVSKSNRFREIANACEKQGPSPSGRKRPSPLLIELRDGREGLNGREPADGLPEDSVPCTTADSAPCVAAVKDHAARGVPAVDRDDSVKDQITAALYQDDVSGGKRRGRIDRFNPDPFPAREVGLHARSGDLDVPEVRLHGNVPNNRRHRRDSRGSRASSYLALSTPIRTPPTKKPPADWAGGAGIGLPSTSSLPASSRSLSRASRASCRLQRWRSRCPWPLSSSVPGSTLRRGATRG